MVQRKPTKNTRGPNADEKRFQGWLKEQNCCVSNEYGVQVHHCLGSTAKQDKVLIGHYFCIPLTPEIHDYYHNSSKAWRNCFGFQYLLWASLAYEYESETGNVIPHEVIQAILASNK